MSVMERVDHAGEAYSNRGRMKDLYVLVKMTWFVEMVESLFRRNSSDETFRQIESI